MVIALLFNFLYIAPLFSNDKEAFLLKAIID